MAANEPLGVIESTDADAQGVALLSSGIAGYENAAGAFVPAANIFFADASYLNSAGQRFAAIPVAILAEGEKTWTDSAGVLRDAWPVINVGFPNAATTGHITPFEDLVALAPSTISTDDTVIEGRLIGAGQLVVTGARVTFRDCYIDSDQGFGIDGENSTDMTVENCTIVGLGLTASGVNSCILTGNGTTVRACDLSLFENGITINGDDVTIEENYIHNLRNDTAAEPHFDGIAALGPHDNLVISGNQIESKDTSGVFIRAQAGAITVTIDANRIVQMPADELAGAGAYGYAVHLDNRDGSGVATYGITATVTNNVLESGSTDYFAIENCAPTFSGNTDYATGDPVP